MTALSTIAPAELARRLGGDEAPVVLAVANEAEFGRHRIRGSRRFGDPRALRERVPVTRLIVLAGCAPDDLTCAWAHRLLVEQGFTDVRVLAGGLTGWIALGLPVETDADDPTSTPTTHEPHA